MGRLGAFQHKGYKIWDWHLNGDGSRLLHLKEDCMDVYEREGGVRMRGATQWAIAEEEVPCKTAGSVCNVCKVAVGRQVLVSATAPPRLKAMPQTFLEVLKDWGCAWMW